MERIVSQNVDIGLRFCLMVCKRMDFENKKSHKLRVFFCMK